MQLTTKWLERSLEGRTMRGYLARPHAAGDRLLPTVLVIQEIWGVDEHIQDMADRFATAGYQALAPDLYSWGETPAALSQDRIQAVKKFLDTMPPQGWGDAAVREEHLSRLPAEEGNRIRETLGALFGQRDTDGMVRQLVGWVDWAASQGSPVVSVGYCMGGMLSFLLVTQDRRVRAAVCNYGRAPSEAQMAAIDAPVYGFYGGTDHGITDAVPSVAEAMQKLGKTFHYKIYPEAGHAFFNDTRVSYNVDAARDAWAETLHFFTEALA
ncbi:MAG: dienelactone hydrolase family protein [Firmicutes bacterium]|nr:dienelactone hydrolase family protein [Bacillota bacterium]